VAFLTEFSKIGLDVFATSTGLGYQVLRHRLPLVGDVEREEWNRVYKTIQQVNSDLSLCASAGN
jgi:hypothetical protein